MTRVEQRDGGSLRGMALPGLRSVRFLIVVVCLAVTSALPLTPSWAADQAKGQEIAEKVCGICHGQSTSLGAERIPVPSFSEIANRPDYTAVRLRAMMAIPPHSDMPTPSLTDKERDDVVSYIQSLRKRR
jgi:mono/diheme cytochrome c family protein